MHPRIPFTQHGFEHIKNEYHTLELSRKDAVAELSRARDLGDRSENGAYKAARQKLSGIDSRLRHLKRLIDNGYVLEVRNKDEVNIGCTVKIHNGIFEQTFYIVGEYEADPVNRKITTKSPLGKGLLHKKAGESVEITTPVGASTYKILSITW